MKKLVNDWIILAEKDVKAASVILNEEYLTNIVAFHCQQAIEKYFKAYILEFTKTIEEKIKNEINKKISE
jgi:HEPN domain-containing protein